MSKEAKRIINLLEKTSEKAARKLVIDIHRELVKETPVDTGWAMNNWFPSIGNPITETAGDPENVGTASAKMAAGLIAVLRWKFDQGVAWVCNNVKYIEKLNAGHSRKAPAGFVESVIQKEVNEAKRKK